MKSVKVIHVILSLVLLFVLAKLALASIPNDNDKNYNDGLLTTEEKSKEIEDRQISTVEPSRKYPIEHYSVDSSNGSFAIGYSLNDPEFLYVYDTIKEVCVYTSDGTFQYGVSFKSMGDFEIELTQGILKIYMIRSDLIITYDSDGELIDIIRDTTDETREYRDNVLDCSEPIKTADETYTTEDRAFGLKSTYNTLKATDSDGVSSVVYKADPNIGIYDDGFIVFFILSFLFAMIYSSLKKRSGY